MNAQRQLNDETEAESDFADKLRGDDPMQISGTDIPKSTLLVAGVLWSILAGLQTWQLITILNMKDKQSEQGGDMRVMTVLQANVTDDVRDLKDVVATHERRLLQLEKEKR